MRGDCGRQGANDSPASVTGSPSLSNRLIPDPVRPKSSREVLATMTPTVLGDEFPHVDEALAALDDDPFQSIPIRAMSGQR